MPIGALPAQNTENSFKRYKGRYKGRITLTERGTVAQRFRVSVMKGSVSKRGRCSGRLRERQTLQRKATNLERALSLLLQSQGVTGLRRAFTVLKGRFEHGVFDMGSASLKTISPKQHKPSAGGDMRHGSVGTLMPNQTGWSRQGR